MGSMFVWIPRFSYLVEGSNISVKFSNGLVDDTSDGYILHPAFNFSSYNGGDTSSSLNYEPQLSESDKLLGFWVAKYPASNNNGKVASKDATEWTNISINNAFVNSKNMFGSNLSSYGISVNSDVTIYDSHLMKNVEWGATAYLACENKIFGGVLFTTGLFLICTRGYNLFTGKVGYLFDNKTS